MNIFEILLGALFLVWAIEVLWKVFGNDIVRWYIDRRINKLGKEIEKFVKDNPPKK